jgi:hypothetical protein
MALETVLISLVDDQVVPAPVDDVVVRVYDDTGTNLITSGTTGVPLEGAVEFTLDGDDPPTVYQLRFHVNGGSINSPQLIEVYSPPANAPTGANNFEVEASMFTLPVATNPRLCRASGYVWGPDGRLRRGVDIDLVPCFRPLVVDGYGILGERVSTRSDADGFVSVDLLRDGIYLAIIESHENVTRNVYVPDRSSVNIFHLLFPLITSVEYDPAGPFALNVGDQLVVTPTVKLTDFRELTGTADADVTYAVDDATIASVSYNDTTLTITGHAAGVTTLRVSRRDNSIVYIPDPGIDGGEITITVT